MLEKSITDGAIAVEVRDLQVLAKVGINPEEIGCRQPLSISVRLKIGAETCETILDTVDYRSVVLEAEKLAETHVPLIETFAEKLGMRCLGLGNVHSVVVHVDKPFALSRGVAGVEFEVSRK